MRISDWSSDVCSSDLVLTSLRWARRRNITFKFDSAHPIGAAHHQKIVVIDDALAFCGGIDMTADRWDTSAHLDDDPRRPRPSGRCYGAWPDATAALDSEQRKNAVEGQRVARRGGNG